MRSPRVNDKGVAPKYESLLLPIARNKATIDNEVLRVNSSAVPRILLIPYLWAGAITAAVALPWLAPGYLFGTDWAGPRFIRWPTQLSSSAPFEAALSAVSAVVSAEIAAKILVLTVVFVAALGAYLALPRGEFVPRAAGSLIYVLNPFVYGRLHYGQLFLIAAYAVLPWLASWVYRLLVEPGWRNGLWLAATVAILAMLAVHLLLVVALFLGTAVISAVVYHRFRLAYLARVGLGLGVAGLATLLISLYWLIPYLGGNTVESQVIARVGNADLAAYSVVSDPSVGLLRNLLGLYGFWAEGVHRFPSLKLFVPGWELVVIAMLVLSAIGTLFVFVVRNETLRSLRWWVTALVLAGLAGLILEAGVADPHTAPLVRWLDTVFPPYRGMRDSGKWASILALVYAQLIPLGLIGIGEGLKGLFKKTTVRDGSSAILAAIAVALPLYYGNGLLFGMHGEIKPSQYPAGWYMADRAMLADPRHDRALFLPWHHYLRISFVRNLNSVIASPAQGFFSIPIVVSGDPEVPGIAPPASEDQRAVQALVNAGGAGDWGHVLALLQIRYVVLAKEVDWENFHYLDQQTGLARIADYGSVVLYRVMANN